MAVVAICSDLETQEINNNKKEDWSELLFPPPGDLPDPGIEPASPVSPAWQADSLLQSHQGSL